MERHTLIRSTMIHLLFAFVEVSMNNSKIDFQDIEKVVDCRQRPAVQPSARRLLPRWDSKLQIQELHKHLRLWGDKELKSDEVHNTWRPRVSKTKGNFIRSILSLWIVVVQFNSYLFSSPYVCSWVSNLLGAVWQGRFSFKWTKHKVSVPSELILKCKIVSTFESNSNCTEHCGEVF